MKCSIFLFIQLLTILQSVKSQTKDCTYEVATSHVENICDSELRERFNRGTWEYMYCNNYQTEIFKGNIRILSFRGCNIWQFSEKWMNSFKNVRVFNASTVGLSSLKEKTFESINHLENLIVSHNKLREIPSNLLMHTPELMEIDLSYNQIEQLASDIFNNVPKLKTIRLAHNGINGLSSQLFLNLVDLEFLDISDNFLDSVESNLLISNKKLKSLNLNNNPLLRLQCEFLMTLNSYSLNISFNALLELKMNCANYSTQLNSNVILPSNESTVSVLTITNGHLEWIFTKSDFNRILNLNFSNSDIKNIPELLKEANFELMTLDLSNTFVGKLNEKTFQKFTNLQYLYLSRTNLSNFQFGTFYHQMNLRVLDLSYNNLNSIDFRLFLRNFQFLETLNLEGNNLTEIDSITRAHFPKLSTLGISKNRFTCEYLAKFLLQWHDLKLVHNPSSNQVHIGGVDCIHGNQTTELTIDDETDVQKKNTTEEPNSAASKNHLNELYTIKLILVILAVMISIICLFMIIDKCKRARRSYKNWRSAKIANESILYTNQEHSAIYDEADNNVYNELSIKMN